MSYSVSEISRYIIMYSNKRGLKCSNLKLQTLLYFVQAYFLLEKNDICFDEKIEAWNIGPVVPEAYNGFKRFGSNDIPYTGYFVTAVSGFSWNKEKYNDNIIKSDDKRLIDDVVDHFSDYSACSLMRLAKSQKPWIEAHRNTSEITCYALKKFFCNTKTR